MPQNQVRYIQSISVANKTLNRSGHDVGETRIEVNRGDMLLFETEIEVDGRFGRESVSSKRGRGGRRAI